VSQSDDPTAGQNPPYGADINYWLKAAPQAAPSIAILDATGKTIRTMSGTRQVGLNRVYWDLRNDATKAARMRTKPMFDAEFQMDADGTRDAGFGSFSVLMPPGHYSVRLTVDGQSFTQPLEVRKDPNAFATDQDIRATTETLLTMQNDMNAASDVLNTIESVRAQLQDLSAQLADRKNANLRVRRDSLEAKFIALEQKLQDLRITGRGQDGVRWPVRLGGQLGYLAGNIGSSDFAPTAQQREVHQVLQKQGKDVRAALEVLMQKDLDAFNKLLKARGLKPIDVELPKVVF
jgi:hypothetical protein